MEQGAEVEKEDGQLTWSWTPPVRFPRAQDVHYARAIVMLHEPSGQSLLLEAEKTGWSQHGWMQPHFEGQRRGSFCALASCAIVLNALRSSSSSSSDDGDGDTEVDEPDKKRRRSGGDDDDDGGDGHQRDSGDSAHARVTAEGEAAGQQRRRLVTQDDLFREIVMRHFHKREKDMRKGLHLTQVARMFALAGARVTLRCSEDPHQVSQWLKEDIAAVFSSRSRCVVVNLWRDFEDHRGGHVSPLAAYHPQRQMVLLLDVASHRTKPHWLSIHDLVPLLCRVDSWSDRARGYLVISNDGLRESVSDGARG